MRAQSPKEIGMVVRDQRAKLGLSQQELADQAGVSRRWLIKVEAGHPGAEIGAVMRLLAALKLIVDIGALGPPAPGQDEAPLVDLDALLADFVPKRGKEDH